MPRIARGVMLPAGVGAAPARRLARRRLSLAALPLLVLALDLILVESTPGYVVTGLLDEPAHAATAALVLAVAGRRRPAWVVGFLLGAVAIDIDHLPQTFGSDVISEGTGRPHSHSLLTVTLLSIVALATRGRPRALAAGAALGVVTHLSRDLATGGVALLWPLSTATVVVPYELYAVLLTVLTLAGIASLRQRAKDVAEGDPTDSSP